MMSVAKQPSNQGLIVAMTTWQGYHHGENGDERRKGGFRDERKRERWGDIDRVLPLRGVDNVRPTACR
ncbi:hypothetical protein CRENBAI_012815 [Crenichthys baileyi]|uniref:Uncharacterized protein n=1 Tax=Crenichthys baileyi TaxID=28760 RepID=A0AAV9QUV5_9TELE